MKQKTNILTRFKQWDSPIVSIWSFQLNLSRLLNKIGVPNTVAKILTKVHHKNRHYKHQYNKDYWKYVMMLY